MLEKSLKKDEFDAHFHYSLAKNGSLETVKGCTCAHSVEEWEKQCKLAKNNSDIKLAFGIHPESVDENEKFIGQLETYLEELAAEGKLDAIGEMGFDFFTDEFKSYAKKQEEVFNFELEIAAKYNLPVVIHCRKANEKLFEYSKNLKNLPAVLFHSFMGSSIEAQSLLNRGINGFFSFGKQVLNNNKKVIECVTTLPLNCLLCETDAPFQTLKGEEKTELSEIHRVYEAFLKLRKENEDTFYYQLSQNFKNLFSLL